MREEFGIRNSEYSFGKASYGIVNVRWFAGLLLTLTIACDSQQASNRGVTETQQQSTTNVITTLEEPQAIAVTQLEQPHQSGASVTQLEVVRSTQTTQTVIQKALTDLKAQETSAGIRINLPENILFDFDKSNIRPSAKPTLQKLSLLLKNYAKAPVTINGYTDSKGSDAYNQVLSQKRAEAVKNYLAQNFSINNSQMTAKGWGEKQPIAPNAKSNGADNPEGRQKNRRVEVIIRN
ncbi:OmpA family protein [Chroococcidiopsis sp. CCNUC1]|uniref:OmpA family protein n=1 Tax=Chroococcidiopsis sp. CCNUC1 TaxID=2653189 RepID=UPI002021D623|nr:OmpA family protein [Chroococcidiopsis sp. CCNUC1]URD52932.1 OmpA family protein [Chroococcidiopsis sp. CCNUC1]